jgi:hypothetical protein
LRLCRQHHAPVLPFLLDGHIPTSFQFLLDFVKTLQKQSKPFTISACFCKDFAKIEQLRFDFHQLRFDFQQLFGISDRFMR